ncbi:hypothetical protein D9615_007729 [Tricholomella constricta]|uniref:Uncharacterized protein n=1 Tax=Tricholomella constricta TaxID=117010 RepID=A0A8H5H3Q4_9AGAR|nr:hypothetical protein D9615_007729 [Tricholomella constricta]
MRVTVNSVTPYATPMSRNDAQEGPASKRRRVMELPDGFAKRNPVDVISKANIQVPKFTSAFDEPAQPIQQKPNSKSKVARLPYAFEISSKSQLKKPVSKTNLRQLPVPIIPLPPKEKEKNRLPAFRIVPPPDPRIAVQAELSSTTTPALQLRPPPLPPPPRNAASSKSGVPLKSLSAPTIFAPTETSPDDSMRTISTTDIALATDLFTDSGAAELAHIFLRDQHPEIAASNKEEHMEWNIGMSPQKGAKFVKGKGKETKFVKGGMAERVREVMARSHTSLALWHKETELKLASSSSSSRRLNPDIRLRIVKIVDSPAGAKSSSPRKPSFSASAGVSPGVAFCHIVSSPPVKHPHLVRVSSRTREEQRHLVVLSFPTTAPPRLRGQKGIYVRNPEDFVLGREVCVWEPWLEVSLTSQSPSVDNTSSLNVDQELVELSVAPFPTLPSTFPRSSPSPVSNEDSNLHIADTVLLCSRFVILP